MASELIVSRWTRNLRSGAYRAAIRLLRKFGVDEFKLSRFSTVEIVAVAEIRSMFEIPLRFLESSYDNYTADMVNITKRSSGTHVLLVERTPTPVAASSVTSGHPTFDSLPRPIIYFVNNDRRLVNDDRRHG